MAGPRFRHTFYTLSYRQGKLVLLGPYDVVSQAHKAGGLMKRPYRILVRDTKDIESVIDGMRLELECNADALREQRDRAP